MRKLVLLSACLLIAGSSAATAVAKGAQPAKGATTCDARYYGYLVGKGAEEARSIEGSDYRMLTAGSQRGEAKPTRMTIVYEPKSNRILEVACG